MKRITRALVAGAAFAGLMTGAVARTYASQQSTTSHERHEPDELGPVGRHRRQGQARLQRPEYL